MKNTSKSILCIILCLSLTVISGQEILPSLKIKTSGAITDLVIDAPLIIVSTDAGTIESFDLNSGKQEKLIQLPKSKDFMGDPIATKIFSVDKRDSQILSVIIGKHGFRNVLIFDKGQQKEVITADKDKMMIKKARWVSDNTILLGLMSNDLVLFDIEQKKTICEINICPYTFSDLCITKDRQFVFTADESGIVHKIEISDCGHVQDYTGINVDNIYQLAYNNNIVITAGQDRRVGVYNTITGMDYFLQKDFLVYSVGLSSDGSIGAYAASEENDISLFLTDSKTDIATLKGHQSVITKIEFIDKKTLVTASDDKFLIIWRIY